MTEALLHTLWKHKLLSRTHFTGTKQEEIEIISPGEHNHDAGPDFFNSKISINGIVLAGNLEIHVRTSDWLKHHHQRNKAYDNLVLHVVYEHDMELTQNETNNVSVLELKSYIKPSLLEQYSRLQSSSQHIPCGNSLATVNEFIWDSFLHRLAISRIEQKTEYATQLFSYYQNNYEDVLYIMLCRHFGFKINNEPFELLGKHVPYAVIKKYADNKIAVEAMLFGTAGFLDDRFEDAFPRLLQNEYEFYKHKYQLIPISKELWKFSKTRPVNFPTIRLSQLADLFCNRQSLFHLLETKPSLQHIRSFFSLNPSDYWLTHFRFDAVSDESTKPFGDVAFQTIVINVIVPFLFFYSKHTSSEQLMDYAMDLLSQLPAEHNAKTREFLKLGIKTTNALQSQAQIHLYDMLCSKKGCLHCNVAQYLLKRA